MLPIQHYFAKADALVYGCMGLGGSWDQPTTSKEQRDLSFSAIEAALEADIRFFDHADIYTRGKAEAVFGEYLAAHSGLREKLILQSKCAIRFADATAVGRYDFSKSYIVESVHQSLKRLQTDYLDILLLHRPDQLMLIDEVAEAFAELKQQGKVKAFGVSNFGWPQMQLLQSVLPDPLVANQLQMSLADIDWLEESVLTGMPQGSNKHFSYGTVEYCQQQGVQLQSWGSLAKGAFSGAQTQTDSERATAALVAQLAEQYQCSREAIVLAWLMRHPAAIQPVIGTANPQRIAACAGASQVHLSREHWYQLFISSRGAPLP